MSASLPTSILERDRTPGRRWARRMSLALLVWTVALSIIGRWIVPDHRVVFSFTDSLPAHVWLVHLGQKPVRGDTIAFRIPKNRFYPHRYGGFLKIARGVAGDQVTREGRDFWIDGVFVGTAKQHSLRGLPLDPGPTGVLPPGHYFVWTPDVDSFDSRYADIGWISQDRVVGVARPLF